MTNYLEQKCFQTQITESSIKLCTRYSIRFHLEYFVSIFMKPPAINLTSLAELPVAGTSSHVTTNSQLREISLMDMKLVLMVPATFSRRSASYVKR